MVAAVFMLQLLLWVASTRAFFIWDACRADNRCGSDPGAKARMIRGFGNGAEEDLSEGLTLEIFERSQPIIHSHTRRASRDFFRLSEKYARRQVSSASGGQLEKRKNEYTVREPAAPKDANTEGIYQDESDYAHFIKAEIGSEKQTLYLLVDTGAGTTWIMGSTCTSSACKLHDTFDPSSSKSLQDTPRNFSIAYGSGHVEGHNVVDNLKFGNVEVSMEFGVAHDTSTDFEHFAFDGILGLSLNKGSTENVPQVVKEDKKFSKNLFSVFLSRGLNAPNDGELTLGGINSEKYSGDITYTDVPADRNGDWAIPIDSIKMDGKDAKLEKSRLGYIDTGTTYIFGPTADVKAVHDLVKGAKSADGISWTVPCDTTLELSFTFSGTTWTVLPQDWIEPPNAKGECQSNVYGHEVVPGAWLLGAQFLKNVYTVFDFQGDTAKIGFAKHAHPDAAKAPGTLSSQTPGATAKPEGGPDMGVGGRETTSTVSSDAQPVSTGDAGSSSSGEMVSGNHIGSMIVTCATIFSILRIF